MDKFSSHDTPSYDYAVEVGESIRWDMLSDSEYVQVIAGLKAGGLEDDAIDILASSGTRYNAREDRKRIASIKPTGGITFATAVHIAKNHGFVPYDWTKKDKSTESTDYLSPTLYPERSQVKRDTKKNFQNSKNVEDLSPLSQTITALNLLFKPTDHINVVLRSFKKGDKYEPYQKKNQNGYPTLESALAMVKKAGSIDMAGSKIDGYNPESGAWIQINPNDGKSGKAEDLMRFDYLLVECDDLPKDKQIEILDKLNLPELYRVDSGGKSIHCIVKVDAKNAEEFKVRKEFIFSYCLKHGFPIDTACGNPGRLSRLPGAYRGGQLQRLLSTERGPASYDEFYKSVQEKTEKQKLLDSTIKTLATAPAYSHQVRFLPSVVDGLLRKGKLMEIVAPPKAGKTWICHGLARAVVSGGRWLGFQCTPGKVLYFCPELDSDDFVWRARKVCEGLPEEESKPIYSPDKKLLGYEGDECLAFYADDGIDDVNEERFPMPVTLDELVACLEDYLSRHTGFSLVIVDPIYCFMDGEENSNSDVTRCLTRLKMIARHSGAAVVFCHHTTKGRMSEKQSIDLPAGAGAYARYPDVILGLKPAEIPALKEDKNHKFFKAFKVDFTVRSFGPPDEDVYVYRDGYGVFHRVPSHMLQGAEVI